MCIVNLQERMCLRCKGKIGTDRSEPILCDVAQRRRPPKACPAHLLEYAFEAPKYMINERCAACILDPSRGKLPWEEGGSW